MRIANRAALVAVSLLLVPAVAYSAGAAERIYSAADQVADDEFLESLDLARIAFVKKNEVGPDLIFIRIPPGMYRFAKARSGVRRRGSVRVTLRPRHYAAIEQATGKRPKRVLLRLDAERLRSAEGLEGHYAVRPLSQFMRGDPSDSE